MKVVEIKENEFEEKIKSINGKILVDCYATWCGPCKMLSPIIDELAQESNDCTFYKIDIDNAETIVSNYNIMSIPTLLLFEDGKLKKQTIGFKSKEELQKLIAD